MMHDDDITSRYHGGNLESTEARDSLPETNLAAIRLTIRALARSRGEYGIICDEAERILNLSHQTCSARFSELKRDGYLRATGYTRRTRTGRMARVMIAAE
jgi:hypothetical protein